MNYSAAIHDQKNSNQVSLFGEAGDDLPEPRLTPVDDWLPAERLTEEFKAVGFYLSGHPLDDYMGALRRKDVKTLDEVIAMSAARAPWWSRWPASSRAGRSANRRAATGLPLSSCRDTTGGYEVTLFSEALEKSRDHLETGAQVVLTVEATMESDQLKLLAPLGRADRRRCRRCGASLGC